MRTFHSRAHHVAAHPNAPKEPMAWPVTDTHIPLSIETRKVEVTPKVTLPLKRPYTPDTDGIVTIDGEKWVAYKAALQNLYPSRDRYPDWYAQNVREELLTWPLHGAKKSLLFRVSAVESLRTTDAGMSRSHDYKAQAQLRQQVAKEIQKNPQRLTLSEISTAESVSLAVLREVTRRKLQASNKDWVQKYMSEGADGTRRYDVAAIMVLVGIYRKELDDLQSQRSKRRVEVAELIAPRADPAQSAVEKPQAIQERLNISADGITIIDGYPWVELEKALPWLPYGNQTREYIDGWYQDWEKRDRPWYHAKFTRVVNVCDGAQERKALVYELAALLRSVPVATIGWETLFRGDSWKPLLPGTGREKSLYEFLERQHKKWLVGNTFSANHRKNPLTRFVRSRAYDLIARANELIGDEAPASLKIQEEKWLRHDTVAAETLWKVLSQSTSWIAQHTFSHRPKFVNEQGALFIQESALKSL